MKIPSLIATGAYLLPSLPSNSLDPYQGCRSLPTLSSYAIAKEGVMVACNPKSFAVALLITVLPMGFAFAGAIIGGVVGFAVGWGLQQLLEMGRRH